MQPEMVHFTEGGPWHGHTAQPYVQEWFAELAHMLGGANPAAQAVMVDRRGGLSMVIRYEDS